MSSNYSISVAALNRTDGTLLTEAVLALTVISDGCMNTIFPNRLIPRVLHKGLYV